jgi:Flp pilus assembly protein TadD
MIQERQNKYDEAQAQYRQTLKLNPKFAPAANNLAWLMAEDGADLDVVDVDVA